ncbi:hypothetical protein RHSP_83390 [Rhizobium freirei PRF 81]|uniref:Protein-disulfide isomerase n=4 Tax=Rhizobium TaxID=379 RepID=A0A1C3XAT8_9HYPH|nr:hypothetical protein RHSP_83390 [Rhizobium freirei PRF 81]MBB4244805.1 protein-disulfide isomerase [Rhizobium tropici]MBB6305736.1 protein-disulfide isomerase [Rhizobium leucaenae]MBB6488170.1 protein-disulfide isomerase [Rhizobium lusitanum]MBB5596192.1 protein-disulfide isomerase [Rhizobium tropici]
MIEYSSPTCPHRVEYRTHVALQIEEEFVRTGKVRIVFRLIVRNNVDMVILMLAERQPAPKSQQILDAYYARHDEIVQSSNIEQHGAESGLTVMLG